MPILYFLRCFEHHSHALAFEQSPQFGFLSAGNKGNL